MTARPRWRTVFFRPANAATAVSVAAGLGCGILAASGHPYGAAISLLVAGVADLLDGPIARAFPGNAEQTLFGQRADSLADACNFGYAPALFGYFALDFQSPGHLAILFWWHVCAIGRLGAFDTFGLDEKEDNRYYRGVPTTLAALSIPIVYCLRGAVDYLTLQRIFLGFYPVMGFAMVSRLRLKKPKKVGIAVAVLVAAAAIARLVQGALAA